MPLFIINYDLVKQKDYQKLWDRLGQYKAKRILLSTWAITGNYTAAGLRDDLVKYIDADDRLFVDQSSDWAGWNIMFNPSKM